MLAGAFETKLAEIFSRCLFIRKLPRYNKQNTLLTSQRATGKSGQITARNLARNITRDITQNIARDMVENMLATIQSRIDKAAADAGLNTTEITLIAVSKQQPEVRIDSALQDGLRVFGENRVQEAQLRWHHRRSLYPELELHLIGPLQSNKAADAVALFDILHTIDRPKIAKAVKQEMDKQNRQLTCFIQVNTGEEPQKAGINPKEIPDFLTFCYSEIGLNIAGLMCIPPIDEEAAMHFALLKSYAEQFSLPQLSMGMSGDFEEAIAFGATHIRVGSALFGARP